MGGQGWAILDNHKHKYVYVCLLPLLLLMLLAMRLLAGKKRVINYSAKHSSSTRKRKGARYRYGGGMIK